MLTDTQTEPRHPNETHSHQLRTIYFYLSEGCNLACSHCWLSPAHDPNGKRYPFLAPGLFEKIIREARPLGLESVKLTGGEPLLHPDIHLLLDIVYREKLELIVETNGILCSPEIARNISRQFNPFVSVSLDGVDSATHDFRRGVPGAFKKTVQAIKSLVENNVRTQIIMSLMQDNVDQVEAMISLAEEIGASSLKFNLVQPIGRGKSIHDADKSISIVDLITLSRKVESELDPQTDVKLYFDIPPAFKSLKQLAPDSDGCALCGIFSILGVLADGHFALCGIGSQIKELVFGHAEKNPLADIWQNNLTLREILQGLPGKMTGICARCLMKDNCLGSCIAHNYYRSGSLWAPFWFCEQAEAEKLFPRSRLI